MPDKIIFTGQGDSAHDRRVSRQHNDRKLVRLHAGIYSDNIRDAPVDVAIRNAFVIAAHLFPDAVISGRSAFELKPSVVTGSDGRRRGYLFLTQSSRGSLVLQVEEEARPVGRGFA